MAASQIFPGAKGVKDVVQDRLAALRALAIGVLYHKREYIQSRFPAMKTGDFKHIKNEQDRNEYRMLYNAHRKNANCESTQKKTAQDLVREFKLGSKQQYGMEDIKIIQAAESHHFRIHIFRYYGAGKRGTLLWAGESDAPVSVYLLTDHSETKFACLYSLKSILQNCYYCEKCTGVSNCKSDHRCEYRCKNCAATLQGTTCDDGVEIPCRDCNKIFLGQACFDRHRKGSSSKKGSRCTRLKACPKCHITYRASRRASDDQHECGANVWCGRCEKHRPAKHNCTWKPLSPKDRELRKKNQKEIRFAFLDIETWQSIDFPEEERFEFLPEHIANCIAIKKVCAKCEANIDEPCNDCPDRDVVFRYKSRDENPNKVIDDCVDYLLNDPSMADRTVICHNAAKFDNQFIIKSLLRKKIKPKVIVKGTGIIRMSIQSKEHNKLTFKDSYLITPQPLASFVKSFQLSCSDKGDFAHFRNEPKYYHTTLKGLPAKRYFGREHMMQDRQVKFDAWWESENAMQKKWKQDDELVRYCQQDVNILARGCLKFRKTMLQATGNGTEDGWCPLTQSTTAASFVQFMLIAEYLPVRQFPYLPERGYGTPGQSKEGMLWLRWIERRLGYSIQHAGSAHGEKRVWIGDQRYRVDGYDDKTSKPTVYEFNGCIWHGCKRCYPCNEMVHFRGDTIGALYQRTKNREDLLRKKYNVEVMWECDLRKELKTNIEMKKFFNETEVVSRLEPRDALYGGRVEVFRNIAKRGNGYEIRYYDVTSLYPYTQWIGHFPVGQAEIITTNFAPLTSEGLLPYRGLIKAKMLAPRSLKIAVLGCRAHNGLIFGNCKSCVMKKQSVCNHENEEDRAFIGTWPSIEVDAALRRGYKLIELYEVWNWRNWTQNYYKDFIRTFMKLKYEASEFPEGVTTEEQKKEYINSLNEDLGIGMLVENVEFNAARRYGSKIMLNSMWGKQAENPDRSNTVFVTWLEFIELWASTKNEIRDSHMLDEDLFMVVYKRRKETIHSNKYSAVHHAAFVTAYGRLHLLELLEAAGEGLCYCDTDSIQFMCRPEDDPFVKRGLLTGKLGELTNEIDPGWVIDEAVYAGCKNYSLMLKNVNDEAKTKNRVVCRGITRDASIAEIFTHELMRELVLKESRGEECEVTFARNELKRKLGDVYTVPLKKKYRPVTRKNVTRGSEEDAYKVPYGFTETS